MPVEVVERAGRSPTHRPGPVSPNENWRGEETQWELLKLSTLSKELEKEASRRRCGEWVLRDRYLGLRSDPFQEESVVWGRRNRVISLRVALASYLNLMLVRL